MLKPEVEAGMKAPPHIPPTATSPPPPRMTPLTALWIWIWKRLFAPHPSIPPFPWLTWERPGPAFFYSFLHSTLLCVPGSCFPGCKRSWEGPLPPPPLLLPLSPPLLLLDIRKGGGGGGDYVNTDNVDQKHFLYTTFSLDKLRTVRMSPPGWS